MAVAVHFEQKGAPMTFLLDVVEIAKVSRSAEREKPTHAHQSHTGLTLAIAFADILDDLGIAHKVCEPYARLQRAERTLDAEHNA